MLVWMTLVAGFVIIAGGILVVLRVDRRWRGAHLQCCRCLEVWFGREKMCFRCGARGQEYDWLARRYAGFPTHDWQGYLDTRPIPRITATVFGMPEPPVVEMPRQRTDSPRTDSPRTTIRHS